MSKRARRLGKKNELRAVEEAIGAALGKSAAEVAANSEDGRKVRRKDSASSAAVKRLANEKK
ncbi:MAG TPA: hypothetical protein VGZ91_13580 [Candidatus Sulfotelmatobacter sp.]|jgi:hypothetical protein|nr:hypothetical protein [Candidatus Sulfotelmatobacter sp.]